MGEWELLDKLGRKLTEVMVETERVADSTTRFRIQDVVYDAKNLVNQLKSTMVQRSRNVRE